MRTLYLPGQSTSKHLNCQQFSRYDRNLTLIWLGGGAKSTRAHYEPLLNALKGELSS